MKIRTFANNQVFSGEHYLERYLHIVNEKLEKIIKGYLYYLSSYNETKINVIRVLLKNCDK